MSKRIDPVLPSARGAYNELRLVTKNVIETTLKKSLEKNERIKVGGTAINFGLTVISALNPYGSGQKLWEVSNEILEEREIDKDRLDQKFEDAINKLDSMGIERLIQIMKFFNNRDLTSILDYILTEPKVATVNRIGSKITQYS